MMVSPPVAVVAATVVAFMAGGLWYGPLFGKIWQAEQNWSEADRIRAKAGMVRLFATTLIAEAVIAAVLIHVLGQIPHNPAVTMMAVLGIAIGIVVPVLAVNYGYAQRSTRLLAIDGGHWFVVFFAMGVVFIALGV